MFGLKSEEERLFEQIDKADAEVERMKSLGFHGTMLEAYARNLRKLSYSYKRLSRKTMVEVAKSRDPKIFAQWNGMWEEMREGKLHPRDLKIFYDTLTTHR